MTAPTSSPRRCTRVAGLKPIRGSINEFSYLPGNPSPSGIVIPVRVGGASPAWENVERFTEFAVDSERAEIVPVSKAVPGDIIVADFQGGKPGTASFKGDHTMIVTGHVGNNPLIAGHGSNRYNLPLYGTGPQFGARPRTEVHLYRDSHPGVVNGGPRFLSLCQSASASARR